MRLTTIALVSSTIFAAGTALAGVDSVNVYFNGVGPGEGVSVVFNGGGISTTAGAFNWTRDAGNPGTLAGFAPTFQTFCIDLTEYISQGGPYAYSTFPAAAAPTSGAGPMGAAREAQLGRMFALYYNSLSTPDQYAGFQLAVWDIALDGDNNLLGGLFSVTGSSANAMANATAFIAGSLTAGPVWPIFAIDDPIGSHTALQGQLMVPTPGAAALIGAGLVAVGRRRRA